MQQTALQAPQLAMKHPRSTALVALSREDVSGDSTESEPDLDLDFDVGDSEPDTSTEACDGEDTAEAVRRRLQSRLAAYFTRGRPRVVLTDNLHTMLSIKRGKGVWTLRMHRMFGEAPPAVLRAVAQYAQTQDREAAGLLRRYIDHNDHLINTRPTTRSPAIDVEGAHHNLQEIFDDLNARYFAGAIGARITWGPRARRKAGRESIKLGSYSVEEALIRIHPVLDAADVPRFFVAWVIYHEMLHEIHDMPVVDGRRIYHTPEFRRAEARFEDYAEAVLWERTQVRKLLDR